MKAVLSIPDPEHPELGYVANLHAALAVLWGISPTPPITKPAGAQLTAFNEEEANETYGDITKALVMEFRASAGLSIGDTLEANVAAHVNEYLLKDEKVGKISGILRDASKPVVEGTNKRPPLQRQGLLVNAYRNVVQTDDDKWPSQSITEQNDLYVIYADLDEPANKREPQHAQMRIYSGEGDVRIAASDKQFGLFKPGSTATQLAVELDVDVDPSRIPTQYEFAEVTALVIEAKATAGIQRELHQLQVADVDTLHDMLKLRLRREQIEHFVIAHLLASDTLKIINKDKFADSAFFYGLLRLSKLSFVKWPMMPEAQIDIGLNDYVGAATDGGNDPHLEGRRRLLAQVLFYSEFANDATGAPPEARYAMSAEGALVEATASFLKARITTNQYLSAQYQEMLKPWREWLAEMRLGYAGNDALKGYIPQEPFHRRVVGVWCVCKDSPKPVADEPLKALIDSDNLPKPYADVAKAVMNGQQQAVDAPLFEFRLLSDNILRLASALQWDRPQTDALLSLQRVALLTQDPAEVGFLLRPGPDGEHGILDGAWKIRMLGQSRFTKAYMVALGGPDVDQEVLRSKADQLFRRATERSEATAHALGEARALATAQHVEALCSREDRDRLHDQIGKTPANGEAKLPSWEMLFGSLDACACDECDSIYGPASYLVDVLQYFKRLDCSDVGEKDKANPDAPKRPRPCLCAPEEAKDVFDVLMSRRPDIGYLDLNCANAMTPVPYIDLVNELLEDFVSRKSLELHLKLEPGPLPDVAVNVLRSNGFLEVTEMAEVTADSLGNRLVRDDRVLLLFEQRGEEAGCPVWRVTQLRQTYGSEKEIGAAPEYENQDAVKVLGESHLSLALPYDANRAEAEAYLAKMETDRARVMRDLSNWSNHAQPSFAHRLKIATETLGLTRAERDLITKPDPDHQNDYWAESADTVVAEMGQLRRFLDKTGLKTEPVGKSELDQLLAGHFINPCGKALIIVSENPSDLAGRCDTSKMRIKGLDGAALDRIHRFLRLWRKLAWPINLLDRLIASPAVGKGKLDQACLVALAEIVWLAAKWDMQPQALGAWFADISLFGEHSDYRRIFLQKRDNGYPYQPFMIDNLCPRPECETGAGVGSEPANGEAANRTDDCPTLVQHKEQMAAALGIPADQLDALLGYWGNEPGTDTPAKLSLRNLSRVWAWFRLSKKLGLKMRELTLLLAMLDIKDALDYPATTYKVREAVALMKKWNLTVADLRFWLLHRTEDADEEAKRVVPDLAIAKLLVDIRAAFQAISNARSAKDISVDDAMSTCVEKLTSALSQIREFTPEKTLQLTNLLQNRASAKEVAELNELLTTKPLNDVEGVAALADEAPVNAAGTWIETAEDPSKITHPTHRDWTSKFAKALLDHLDQLARNETVVRLASQQTKAPVEQLDAILRWCRMPKDGVPAMGASLLGTLAAPEWAANPMPAGATPEQVKAIEVLWDGALCSTQICVEKLQEKPRKFRTAVLAGTPITAWTEPPQPAQVEQWRGQLSPLFVAIRLAHKVAGLAKALKLQTEEQLAWGLWRAAQEASPNRFQQLGWFSLDEVPLAKPADNSELAAVYPKWVLLLEGLNLIEQYPCKETAADPNVKRGASTALELALKPGPTDPHGNPAIGVESIRDILAVCYEMFAAVDLEFYKVAEWLELSRAAFRVADAYRHLLQASIVVQRIGISPASLPALVDEGVKRDLALILRQCLKQQEDAETWLDTLKEIQDPIRERKRDALIAYLIADPHHGCFREVNDLYDHFLIDPQMCACMPTSRIVQGHAVVQLFAQRCLMGQEPSVDPRADDNDGQDWKEWPWMRNYRVWQANRKVFLYPENWIEPELRDDKSQFFKEFEQTLLQTEVNDSNVEVAARTYLDKLDDAAFMEVMAIHYQDTEFAENGKREGRVLHVVARTKGGDPPTYYYRRFVDENTWTPWEKIDLEIATDHVLLFVRNGRLNLAWPEFTDVAKDESTIKIKKVGDETYDVPRAPRRWTIQLAMSERSNGRWQSRRVSKDAIKSDEVIASIDELTSERMRCRFVIRDREPRQAYFLDKEENPTVGFFILAYSFIKKGMAGELVSIPSEGEPTLIGGFNLAGCRGYPESVTAEVLGKIASEAAISIPRIQDVAFQTQRWIEQNRDAANDLVVQGLIGNNFAPTSVLLRTPGTFKVTTTQQTTFVDDVLMDVLKVLNEEPSHWRLSGIMIPFFYEDGRRGYVALPTVRFREKTGIENENTVSDFVTNLERLASDIKSAANSKPRGTWSELVEKWSNNSDKEAALEALTLQLGGCFGLKFIPFYHPFVCLMKRSLAGGGFERLMNASPVEWKRQGEFDQLFRPQSIVLKPFPKETVSFQFDRNEGYASYNWEVFYHLPSLVSQKLVLGQRFEDALRWFHFVFNPSGIPEPGENYGQGVEMPPTPKGPGRYWVTKPFRIRRDADGMDSYVGERIDTILSSLGDPNNQKVGSAWQKEVTLWRRNPFVPHEVARGRTVAFQKATFMRYLDALIQWGDFLFRQDTRESVNAALQLYITVERLLGPRPRVVKAPGRFRSRTYRELQVVILGGELPEKGFDSFGNSLVELENLLPAQPPASEHDEPCMPPVPAGSLLTAPYFCIPRNEKLMGYWDTVADRLYKIRHCQNIEGIERQLALFAPPIDPGLLVRAIAAGLSIGAVLAQGAGEVPHYRFQILSQKATELVQMVITLGSALLQAIEKKDAETVAQLRSNQEINLLKLVRQIKLQQIQEAEHNLAALERAKWTTEERLNYYRHIERQSNKENDALLLLAQSDEFDRSAASSEGLAHIYGMLPNLTFGVSGLGSAHVVATFGGATLSAATSASATAARLDAGLLRSRSTQIGTGGGYDRRWDDWKFQERLADRELAQIDRQFAAAEIRVDIAKNELANHDKQIEQAQEVLAYLKDRKFSNQDLYDWMIGQISATYFQSWQMAHRFALRVERAFHFELGPKNDRGEFDSYVRFDLWDSLHKGLLAGEQLQFDLKRMEVDYLERNRREFEITKSISLVRLDPDQFLKLKRSGECKIVLPDWLFDMDYPGHYFRRIKSMSLSVPCVAGPYASVNCTLTLTKSEIRIRDKQNDDDDDSNLLRNFSRVQSIATSTAQNDSGLFEVSFRDERYLPFEGAGAISTWSLQLRREDNLQIDFDSLTDVILHLKYTARRGGKQFESERRGKVGEYLTSGYPDESQNAKPIAHRLFMLKDEFPGEWHRFINTKDGARPLSLDGLKDRLPYFSRSPKEEAAEVKLVRLDTLAAIEPPFELAQAEAASPNAWNNVGWGRWDFTWTGAGELPLGLLVCFTLK